MPRPAVQRQPSGERAGGRCVMIMCIVCVKDVSDVHAVAVASCSGRAFARPRSDMGGHDEFARQSIQ